MITSASLRAPTAFRPVLLATAVASLSAPALAQEQALSPVVVTATRSAQAARDVLPDSVVITAEEIARSGQTTLADLLQRRRGVEISRNGGPGTQTSVFLRGSENKQNVVLVDGVRTGSSTSGGASWAAIPLSQIDRIEIVYGPLSTLYGSDAVGGVVQIFTKKGDGAPKPTVSAGFGSYDTKTLEAGVSGSANTFRYAISAGHEESKGFSATKPGLSSYNPDDDGYQRDSVSGNFSLELAKGHELGLRFLHSKLDAEVDLFGTPSFNARGVTRLESYAVYSKNRFLPNWTSQFQVARSKDKSDSIASSGTTVFNTTQDLFSWQNDIALGTDVLQLLAERREERIDSTTRYTATERTTNSVAASYLLKRGPHLASVGARHDDISGYGSKATGSIGYGYRINSALRANASFGTSFRAPTFNELYFPGFGLASNKPEKGRNAEAGLYYEGGATHLSAVYYRNRVTDLIVTLTPCPNPAPQFAFGCAYNVNEATLSGLTLGGDTRFGNFLLRGTLDLQDPRDETTGKKLPRRARHHGTVAVEYDSGAIHAGVETVFSGKRYDTAANTAVLGGYGLLNLYASYDVAPNWSVFGRWNNVLDKDYELARNYATAGSNVFVGVRYGFK